MKNYNRIDVKIFFDAIQERYELSKTQLCSPMKSKTISRARVVAMYVLRKMGYSYPVIGDLFSKNHATAILAFRRVEESEELQLEAEQLAKALSSTPISIIKESPLQYKGYNKHGKWRGFFGKYRAECQVCSFEDIVEVHHIKPIKNGGSHDESNILILCSNHHKMLHAGWLHIKKIKPKRLLTEI